MIAFRKCRKYVQTTNHVERKYNGDGSWNILYFIVWARAENREENNTHVLDCILFIHIYIFSRFTPMPFGLKVMRKKVAKINWKHSFGISCVRNECIRSDVNAHSLCMTLYVGAILGTGTYRWKTYIFFFMDKISHNTSLLLRIEHTWHTYTVFHITSNGIKEVPVALQQ